MSGVLLAAPARAQRDARADFSPSAPDETRAAAKAPAPLDGRASSAAWPRVGLDGLARYKAALALDADPGATPADKAASWRRLGRDEKELAAAAGERAAQWDAFASATAAADQARFERVGRRNADWDRLSRLLSQAGLPEADKSVWSARFLEAYWLSPGVDAEAAAALAPHVPPGAMRTALEALALKVRQKEPAAAGGDARARAPEGSTGIEWITIPGGSFIMGYGAEEQDAQPAHRVAVKTFQIAKTLVTNKQYKACVAAGACTPPV
ncbi:MAG TPA: SUMF1/EgtB/PvdO family nonheme iron enzyme, partial [Elusimicrobiota bacterium]|nr:SUMF1/EgtB/PvdO family nonheme iron enzyme [Elusimicrobiota bacterium]